MERAHASKLDGALNLPFDLPLDWLRPIRVPSRLVSRRHLPLTKILARRWMGREYRQQQFLLSGRPAAESVTIYRDAG